MAWRLPLVPIVAYLAARLLARLRLVVLPLVVAALDVVVDSALFRVFEPVRAHLALLGVLVCRVAHAPTLLGILLVVAGLGYVVDGFGVVLFASYSVEWLGSPSSARSS